SVNLVVGRHDRQSPTLHNPSSKSRKNEFPEGPFRDVRRRDVPSALWLAVTCKVLYSGDDVLFADRRTRPLECSDGGYAHTRHQVGILAERLLRPTPPRVTIYVQQWRVEVMMAARACLGCGHAVHFVQQIQIPSAG